MDNLELAKRYVRAIAHTNPELLDEAAMRRWLTVAPVATKYWAKVVTSPTPFSMVETSASGETYAEMYIKGRRLAIMEEEVDEIAEHAGVPAFGITDRHDPQKPEDALVGIVHGRTFRVR